MKILIRSLLKIISTYAYESFRNNSGCGYCDGTLVTFRSTLYTEKFFTPKNQQFKHQRTFTQRDPYTKAFHTRGDMNKKPFTANDFYDRMRIHQFLHQTVFKLEFFTPTYLYTPNFFTKEHFTPKTCCWSDIQCSDVLTSPQPFRHFVGLDIRNFGEMQIFNVAAQPFRRFLLVRQLKR